MNIHGFQKLFEHFSLSKEENISLLKSVIYKGDYFRITENSQLVIELLINSYIHIYIL